VFIRSAVVEYISVAGQRKQSDTFSFIQMPQNLHPTLKYVPLVLTSVLCPITDGHFALAARRCTCRQAFDDVLLDYFENTVFPAHLFENEEGWNVVLSTLPPGDIRDKIAKGWQSDEQLTPRERWDQFFVVVSQAIVRYFFGDTNRKAEELLRRHFADVSPPLMTAGEARAAKHQSRVRHRVHLHLPAVGHPSVQAPSPFA
jgi:hypothetical protein